MTLWKASLLSALLALSLAACAPKTAKPVITGPVFPDYPFPAVPETLEAGNQAAAQAHRDAWSLLQGGNARAGGRLHGRPGGRSGAQDRHAHRRYRPAIRCAM